MKYQQITIDGRKMVRQMPQWFVKTNSYQGEGGGYFNSELEAQKKFHEWVKYDGHLQAKTWEPVKIEGGQVYPSELNLPDGTVVEEGRDFEFRKVPCRNCNTDCYNWMMGDCNRSDTNTIAMHRQPKQESEDELWSEVISLAFDEFGHTSWSPEAVKNFITVLEQRYIIGKRLNVK